MATPWVILGRFLRDLEAEEEARDPHAAAAAVDADALALVLAGHRTAAPGGGEAAHGERAAEEARSERILSAEEEAQAPHAAAVDADGLALVLADHRTAAPGGAEAAHGERAAQEALSERVVLVDKKKQERAEHVVAVDAPADEEDQERAERVVLVDEEEQKRADDFVAVDAPTEHAAAAAEPDFTVSAALPPRVTILTARRGIHPDPGTPDESPCIIAAAPSLLLVHFTGPPLFGTFSWNNLIMVGDFREGPEGQATASAARIPNRGDRVPVLWNLEHVVFDSDVHGHYRIAELQVTRNNAMLIYLDYGDDGWSMREIAYPPVPSDRRWTAHGAMSADGTFWWFDLSCGILSCDAAALAEAELIFHELPGQALCEATSDIHNRRCVAASRNKLRYVEVFTGGGGEALVRMWSRSRDGSGGWKWSKDWELTFRELWDDDTYKDAGLPRNVPVLAAVCPSDPSLVYFALEHRLFGVNVHARRMIHSEIYEVVDLPGPPRPASGRYVVAWELPPSAAQAVGMTGWTWAQPHWPEPASIFEQEDLLSLQLPRLHIDSDEIEIQEVWKDTSEDAFSQIGDILKSVGTGNYFVALDTEFCVPDRCQCLPYEPPTPDGHYLQLKSYVHGGDLVQVGIGIADTQFKLIGGIMFQFNLLFDPTSRSADHPGVRFLRKSGLKLEEHASKGLPASEFIHMLRESGLLQNKNVTWVTYNGYPDFGFMINLLSKVPLPEGRLQFLSQVREYFPSSCDCKFFSKYGKCINRERVPGKLDEVAAELGVRRTGRGHQAASDALLSLRCLQQLKALAPNPDFYKNTCGVLYGLNGCQYLLL